MLLKDAGPHRENCVPADLWEIERKRVAALPQESWTTSAWADLSQALETRNFDLLPEAIEECEAVLNAIHAADLVPWR